MSLLGKTNPRRLLRLTIVSMRSGDLLAALMVLGLHPAGGRWTGPFQRSGPVVSASRARSLGSDCTPAPIPSSTTKTSYADGSSTASLNSGTADIFTSYDDSARRHAPTL